jgi:arylsulfatase A-like enzyme
MATFADLAGVDPPEHTDGISIVPTLLGNPEQQVQRDYLYWEYHWGKQQAVRMGRYKGVRIGGILEPVELYDLSSDPGEEINIAADNQEIVDKIDSIMFAARDGSPFNPYWPLPEHRLYNVRWDRWIFEQLENDFAH